MRPIRKLTAAMLLPVVIAVPGACLAASRAHSRHGTGYVGTVRDTRAFIAVVVRRSHVIAYVCDSRRIAQWFKGTVHAGKARLTSDGYVLRVTIGPRRTTGSVRFPGMANVRHGFTAARATKPAGLYRGVKKVAGKRYVGGWVILPDGRQRGEVVSNSTDVANPILNPDNPTVDVKRGKKRPLIIIIAILIG